MPVHQLRYLFDAAEAGFILLTCMWTGAQYVATVTLQRKRRVAADVYRFQSVAGPMIVATQPATRYRSSALLSFTQHHLAALNNGEYLSDLLNRAG